MSVFHDIVREDVQNIFLDLDVFAEMHSINGVDVACVIDKNLSGPLGESVAHPIEGVFENMVHLFVREGDIVVPGEGKRIKIDGSTHIVRHVSVEMGMVVITAEESRAV